MNSDLNVKSSRGPQSDKDESKVAAAAKPPTVTNQAKNNKV